MILFPPTAVFRRSSPRPRSSVFYQCRSFVAVEDAINLFRDEVDLLERRGNFGLLVVIRLDGEQGDVVDRFDADVRKSARHSLAPFSGLPFRRPL
jgi:hypothetical protein